MVSTVHSYAALQRRLNKILAEEQRRAPGFCGYAGTDVASRLIQRYAELCVFEFTRFAAEKYRKTGSLPVDEETVNCAGLLIEADRKIRLSKVKFIALIFNYLSFWGYAFLVILSSLRLFGIRKQLSLLYGVGLQDLQAEGSDARFLNFCHASQLKPLMHAQHLIVQATQTIRSTEPMHVRYGRIPLLIALRWGGLGFRAWLRTLAEHLYSVLGFGRAVYLYPNLILLGHDAASHASAVALNREGRLKDVILTNSNYFSQPLWTWALPNRTYTCHMVWYSQNNYPISYVDEDIVAPIPNLRYIRSDLQWVWSDGFRRFLEDICPPCAYKLVSPIVWYLPSGQYVKPEPNKLRIALFDVTPISYAAERKFGVIRNFYSQKNVRRFLQDVVNAVQTVAQEGGRAIEVVLKHKREFSAIHSIEYINAVDSLANSGAIKLIRSDSNLYDLVQESDFVIAMPYSSPVYVARSIGKDAVWYDPTAELSWKCGRLEIALVQGLDALTDLLREKFII